MHPCFCVQFVGKVNIYLIKNRVILYFFYEMEVVNP